MATSGFGAVKLISLDIIEFKELQRGKVSWEYQVGTKFAVINVQSFDERTMIFEALQFGFGNETDAKKGAVTVKLQLNTPTGKDEILLFSHLKSERFGHQFKVKIEGDDTHFRGVEQNEYFDLLKELKIFASTQSFLLDSSCKDILATNNIDLRQFLEMHLMNKRDQTNDYDETQLNLEMLYEQKKTFRDMVTLLNNWNKGYEIAAENQCAAAETDKREQDLHSLHMFYHMKTIEMMRNKVEHLRILLSPEKTPNIAKGELIDHIHDWTAKMEKNALMALAHGIDMNRAVLNYLSEQTKEDIDAIKNQIKCQQIATHASIDQFSRLYSANLEQLLDCEFALDKAKIQLWSAKWQKKTRKILPERSASPFEEKAFEDLFGPISFNEDFMKNNLIDIKAEIMKSLIGGENMQSKLKTYKLLGDHTPRAIKKALSQMPATGHFTVETDNLQTADRIETLLGDKHILGQRTITLNYVSPESMHIEPLIKEVRGTNDKTEGVTKCPAASAKKTAEERLAMNREMLDLKKFMDQKCPVRVKDANNGNDTSENEEITKLEQELINAESALANLYLDVFGDILKELGFGDFNEDIMDPKAIINAVNVCTNAINLTGQDPRPSIQTFRKNLADLEKDRLFFDEAKQKHVTNNVSGDLLSSDDLLEGNKIADEIRRFTMHTLGQLVILLNEAAVESKLLMVEYLDVQTRKLDLPENRSPEAFFNCIHDEYRPVIDPNERSFEKIRDAVSANIQKIEQVLCVLGEKNESMHYMTSNNQKFKKAQTKMNSEMVKEKRKLEARSAAFEEPFKKLEANFESLANYCRQKWGMQLGLSYNEPYLHYPIQMVVSDLLLDAAYNPATSLNHYAASLVLRLAINVTIGSPILIVDSLDFMIESNLISPIMELLEQMVNDKGIQVVFMQVKAPEQMVATSNHHMWTEKEDQEHIAETTSLISVPIDEEFSRLSIRSASSPSGFGIQTSTPSTQLP